jgi:hypothetical protein
VEFQTWKFNPGSFKRAFPKGMVSLNVGAACLGGFGQYVALPDVA